VINKSHMTVHEYCRQWTNNHYLETADSEKIELIRTLIKNDLFMRCVREKGFTYE
jgi:hypothetical protein